MRFKPTNLTLERNAQNELKHWYLRVFTAVRI